MSKKERAYEDMGDIELDPDTAAMADRKIREAESGLGQEVRVTFRWNKRCLDLVKQAAEARGIPYQTYMKQVVYSHALEDLSKDLQVREHIDKSTY